MLGARALRVCVSTQGGTRLQLPAPDAPRRPLWRAPQPSRTRLSPAGQDMYDAFSRLPDELAYANHTYYEYIQVGRWCRRRRSNATPASARLRPCRRQRPPAGWCMCLCVRRCVEHDGAQVHAAHVPAATSDLVATLLRPPPPPTPRVLAAMTWWRACTVPSTCLRVRPPLPPASVCALARQRCTCVGTCVGTAAPHSEAHSFWARVRRHTGARLAFRRQHVPADPPPQLALPLCPRPTQSTRCSASSLCARCTSSC